MISTQIVGSSAINFCFGIGSYSCTLYIEKVTLCHGSR